MTSDFKVICISNIIDGYVVDLLVGNVYDVIEYDDNRKGVIYYQIKTNDANEYAFYNIELFKRLDEFRNERLKELGI